VQEGRAGDAGVKSSDINNNNKIILVGGMTCMPKVVETVKSGLKTVSMQD